MTASRVLITAIAFTLLTGCGTINNGQAPPQQPSTDTRPIRSGGTLRVALNGEPDKLDPSLSRTLVGREVFQAICEKLYEADEKLTLVPQLAAALPDVSPDGKTVTIKLRTGLKFADGTVMDAAAVKTSLDRHRTLTGSQRKSELGPLTDVTVVDPATVALHLSQPFSPLVSQLADRAGMIMSPAALAKTPDFGTAPVCIGPFKFATRVAQDRTEVVKDPNYYNAANVKLDKIVYKTVADPTTSFNNLRSGDIDIQFNVSPINVEELKSIPNLRLLSTESLGYQGITVNVGNANGVGQTPGTLAAPVVSPMATDARIRQAFAMSIDREAITKTVFRGVYSPACGPISPAAQLSSDAAQACPKHDPAAAKRLLADAGVPTPVKISLVVVNDSDNRRVGEAIKSMAADGGFDVQLEPTEFASSLDLTDAGKYQMFRIGWSGRIDADGNITTFVQTKGSQNIAGYSNPQVDQWLNDARATQDVAARRELYGKVIAKIQQDSPLIYLYRAKNLIGLSDKVGGVKMYADFIMRFDTAGFVQ
ncbi:ABC transporter substrate-binding protein [Actinocrispum wychmicini]|uniref:Peptide/nickel transport system substrate-binding protein n=1 Tax=Actinocrispum wychmicini TaxID=1213861 RepID=A0A4R2JDI4_9PSEU|nr:ABC transporter substrate-binding protein [Actinocrispum wychmicini]TCO54848.1 peptide/nickel transport system substrate-binding protein [Actinocrispum wychmicini]